METQLVQLVLQGGALGILAILIFWSLPRAVVTVCQNQKETLAGFQQETKENRAMFQSEMKEERALCRDGIDKLKVAIAELPVRIHARNTDTVRRGPNAE